MTSLCSNTHQPAHHLHIKREIISSPTREGQSGYKEVDGSIWEKFGNQINGTTWLICIVCRGAVRGMGRVRLIPRLPVQVTKMTLLPFSKVGNVGRERAGDRGQTSVRWRMHGKWRQQVWGENKDRIEVDTGFREGSEGLGFRLCARLLLLLL